MNPGLIGGIVGSVIGVIGGAIGTWASIHNTDSPREHRFMMRCAVVTWIGVPLFIAAMLLIPRPYNFLLWLPYLIALPLAIRAANRRQARIRAEAGTAG